MSNDVSVQPRHAAIVGTGFMASVHAEALRRIGIHVLGVVGSSPERGRQQAEALSLPTVYPTFDEMLADDRVNVVHVCTPNHLHHEHALGALRAGKHVVCEKPLAMSTAEAAELRTVAHASGLVHAICFMNRFYPQCQEAKRRVQSGDIGDVRLLVGTYLQDWLANESDWNWRLDPALGGALRTVGDIGSHWLDLASFVSGHRIEAVMADLATVIPSRKRPVTATAATFQASTDGPVEPVSIHTDDVAGVLIRFEGGSRGVLALSQVSPGRKNHQTLEVSGSTSSLCWRAEDPDELWIGHRNEPNQILLRGAVPGSSVATAGDYPAGHAQGFPDTFKAMFRAIYRAVAAGGPPAAPDYATFDDGLEQAVIADAIATSGRHGGWTGIARDAVNSVEAGG